MKHFSFAPLFTAALCAAVALAGPTLRAQAYFDIHIDTSALVSNPAAPFYLDFQLNDGSGVGNNNNSAILSNFNFHGGAALSTLDTVGGATGNLSSTVTLNDSSAFNEFFQSFTAGTALDFRLQLSTQVNSGTPDIFAFSILDKNLLSLPTTAASSAFIEITIDGLSPSIAVYSGDVANGGFPMDASAISAVPEPSTYAAMAGIAILAVTLWKRRGRLKGPCLDS